MVDCVVYSLGTKQKALKFEAEGDRDCDYIDIFAEKVYFVVVDVG